MRLWINREEAKIGVTIRVYREGRPHKYSHKHDQGHAVTLMSQRESDNVQRRRADNFCNTSYAVSHVSAVMLTKTIRSEYFESLIVSSWSDHGRHIRDSP